MMFQFWNITLFGFESYFFLLGTDHSLKVHARMEDKVRIKNLKSLLVFFKKLGRVSPYIWHYLLLVMWLDGWWEEWWRFGTGRCPRRGGSPAWSAEGSPRSTSCGWPWTSGQRCRWGGRWPGGRCRSDGPKIAGRKKKAKIREIKLMTKYSLFLLLFSGVLQSLRMEDSNLSEFSEDFQNFEGLLSLRIWKWGWLQSLWILGLLS